MPEPESLYTESEQDPVVKLQVATTDVSASQS